MRILIIKTSSLGDVIHTLPALTDAAKQCKTLHCDWVVEEAFSEIPAWHPAVSRVIPVAIRRWRRHPLKMWKNKEWQQFKQSIQQEKYDYVIDAQGLFKSAVLTAQAKGIRCGLDGNSAREPIASWFYDKKITVSTAQHAVIRTRLLFANLLNYELPTAEPDYGIKPSFQIDKQKHVIFLHGTTWTTKHWYDDNWADLAKLVTNRGYQVRIPWGNEVEKQRAEKIAASHDNIHIIDRGNLQTLGYELAQAQAVVGVDTGLAHLAAALDVPSVTLYGATKAGLTGTMGKQQIHLNAQFPCAPCLKKQCSYKTAAQPPCYQDLSVDKVWRSLKDLL
ncbi:lipopolysaccharide heptosyltransferase I [Candidatus Albibeggiatoa sp. nov. NOAA]|uniref:lipopolysaccharide heptosyltransferase I n=1 Tax=Candidatus Albibeggiatoa sp. nov. NOAA TaxID=3162724 RepID=UPI0032F8FAB0|nr:lipopolysaccharide heptosyltransferase I [Thiotrichaceae bacterium]